MLCEQKTELSSLTVFHLGWQVYSLVNMVGEFQVTVM
jgi:hypothetical protein